MSYYITITSVCIVYYRKMCLIPDAIASEPIRGWHDKGNLIPKQHWNGCIGKNVASGRVTTGEYRGRR